MSEFGGGARLELCSRRFSRRIVFSIGFPFPVSQTGSLSEAGERASPMVRLPLSYSRVLLARHKRINRADGAVKAVVLEVLGDHFR